MTKTAHTYYAAEYPQGVRNVTTFDTRRARDAWVGQDSDRESILRCEISRDEMYYAQSLCR